MPGNIALGVGIAIAVFVVSFININEALYILIFAMLLSPEFGVGGGGGEGGMEAKRAVALRLEDLLLVIIGFSWLARMAVYKELGFFLKTPLNNYIRNYVIACVVATAWGMMMGRVTYKSGFFFVLKYIEYFIVYFMAVNNIHERKQIKNFAIAMIVSCVIVSIVGIAQIPSGRRVSAPFEGEAGEPNTFGGYLVLMLSMIGGLFLTSESGKQKTLYIFISILIILPLMFTLSRSSWIALLPMYIVLIIYSEKKKLLIAGLVLMLSFGPFLLPKNVAQRVLATTQQQIQKGQKKIGGMRIDTSASARIESWQEALSDFTEHPILGYGVTGYRFLDAQYPKVLVDTGILGFAAFAMMLIALVRQGIHSFHTVTDRFYKGLSIGFIAGTAAMIAHGIGSNTFIIVRIMEPYWFFAAMVILLPTIEAEEKHLVHKIEEEHITELLSEEEEAKIKTVDKGTTLAELITKE
ncbi:MAG: O-antigen ligase family protein [Nitrospinae bacterium]|nr:O-antigen ligase family protein [Nitrospinota bacterium]